MNKVAISPDVSSASTEEIRPDESRPGGIEAEEPTTELLAPLETTLVSVVSVPGLDTSEDVTAASADSVVAGGCAARLDEVSVTAMLEGDASVTEL